MSGGYFDRSLYAMCEIAYTIERDIARALQPKPEKVYENYWTITVSMRLTISHIDYGYLWLFTSRHFPMQNDESLKSQHDSSGVVQLRFRQKSTCPAVSGTAEGVLITF